MKRFLAVTLLLVTLLCLAACGEGKDDYRFSFNGNKISIGDEAADVVKTLSAQLGEPKTKETPACGSAEIDVLYDFGNLKFCSKKDGKTETIYLIQLFDDSLETSEHIRIGDTREKVESVYGTPDFTTDTTLFYNRTSMYLAFQMKDGCVSIIEYREGLFGEE